MDNAIQFPIGRNVEATVIPGQKLILTVDLTKGGMRSQKGEGKNLTIATTGGNVLVPGTERGKVNLTFFVPLNE